MSWSVGNLNGATASGSVGVTVAAGQLVIVFGSYPSSVTPGTCTDSLGNTYTLILNRDSDRPATQAIYATVNGVFTGALTATLPALTVGVDAIHIACFSNSSGTIPGTANNTNSAVSTQTVNLTTTVANTLVVGFGDASTSNAVGTGFTIIRGTSNSTRVTSEYQTALTNSIGTITVALVEGQQRGILAVAFNPPSSGFTAKQRRTLGPRVGSRQSGFVRMSSGVFVPRNYDRLTEARA